MIDPFLNFTLHPDFREPVNVIGSGFVIGRFGYKPVKFFVCIITYSVVSVNFHPYFEFMMENDVFFPTVSHLIHKVHACISVIWVHFPAAFVNRHKDWFNP